MSGGNGMGYLGWIFGALVVVGVIILVIVSIRLARGARSRMTGTTVGAAPSAVPRGLPKQILDERYARGELTTAEYRERVAALGLGT